MTEQEIASESGTPTKRAKRKGRHRSKKPLTRSQMMQAVHSEDTRPEITVRQGLFKAGFRYRLHRRDLPGTPDIYILKYGVAIFINGCFWHQHGCKLTSRPKSNADFWNDKFDNNIVRDIKTQHALSLKGIRVATIWECSLKGAAGSSSNMNREQTLERLIAFIKSDEETIEI